MEEVGIRKSKGAQHGRETVGRAQTSTQEEKQPVNPRRD
jgi:hypothetical protein